MSEYSDYSDASMYVRACGEPGALGMHPAWIAFAIAAIFLNHWSLRLLCAAGILFIFIAKRKNMTLFDLVRRIRRWAAGNYRKSFRSY
jgi:hypothetical protein